MAKVKIDHFLNIAQQTFTQILEKLQFNIKNLKMNKKQMLTIDYNDSTGILFKWNFSNLLQTNIFYRHYLVIYSQSIEEVKLFVEKYINKLKTGDLFCILYIDQNYNVVHQEFHEKFAKKKININRYIPEKGISAVQGQRLIQAIQGECGQFSQPVVVNIYTSNEKDKKMFMSSILSRRRLNIFDFIVTIFGPFQTQKVSMNEGISCLSYLNGLNKMISYQIYLIYYSALVNGTLSITCNNGQVISSDKDSWTNVAFNKIERKYFAPSIKYDKDVLSIHFTQKYSGIYDLTINFQFKCLDNVVYSSEKKIIINFDNKIKYQQTYTPREPKEMYIDGNVCLSQNPYSNFTMVQFIIQSEKNKEKQNFFSYKNQ